MSENTKIPMAENYESETGVEFEVLESNNRAPLQNTVTAEHRDSIPSMEVDPSGSMEYHAPLENSYPLGSNPTSHDSPPEYISAALREIADNWGTEEQRILVTDFLNNYSLEVRYRDPEYTGSLSGESEFFEGSDCFENTYIFSGMPNSNDSPRSRTPSSERTSASSLAERTELREILDMHEAMTWFEKARSLNEAETLEASEEFEAARSVSSLEPSELLGELEAAEMLQETQFWESIERSRETEMPEETLGDPSKLRNAPCLSSLQQLDNDSLVSVQTNASSNPSSSSSWPQPIRTRSLSAVPELPPNSPPPQPAEDDSSFIYFPSYSNDSRSPNDSRSSTLSRPPSITVHHSPSTTSTPDLPSTSWVAAISDNQPPFSLHALALFESWELFLDSLPDLHETDAPFLATDQPVENGDQPEISLCKVCGEDQDAPHHTYDGCEWDEEDHAPMCGMM